MTASEQIKNLAEFLKKPGLVAGMLDAHHKMHGNGTDIVASQVIESLLAEREMLQKDVITLKGLPLGDVLDTHDCVAITCQNCGHICVKARVWFEACPGKLTDEAVAASPPPEAAKEPL